MCIFLHFILYKNYHNWGWVFLFCFFFWRWLFWVQTTLCSLQNWTFCPITPFQIVRFEKFLHKYRSFLQDDHFEYQCYVIFKIECFVWYLCSKLSDLKNSFTNRDHFFQTIIPSTINPMLSSKFNALSHNSVPSGQIWKIPSQIWIIFSRQSFWVPPTPCYLQNSMLCPITLFYVVRFEKFLHKQGSFFEMIV